MSQAATTGIEEVAEDRFALRRRAVLGTIWTVGSTYSGQIIRLASNLVVSRLLFPEAFGLMAVALLIGEALALFSDLGIQQSLIRDPRGDEPAFINTGWTIQVIRGAVLWVASCVVALGLYVAGAANWLPAGSAFADPRLVTLLPVVALVSLAAGFNSTKLYTVRRHLQLGAESIYQLATKVIAAVIMITAAWIYPSVWALAVGTVLGTIICAVITHVFLPGPANRFAWEREAAGQLIRFGRIIFISTSFTFIATGAQRVILGSIMPADVFGIFSIALLLSTAITLGLERVNENVLFPLYSRLAWRSDSKAMRKQVVQVRLRLLAVTLPPMWVIVIFGQHIVRWLYDARYHDAGWMLQILALGGVSGVIAMTVQSVMLAHGDAKRHMQYTVSSSLLLVACVAIGGYAGAVPGVLIGAAAGRLVQHLVLLVCVRRYGINNAALDLGALAVSAAVIAAGWQLFSL